MVPHTHTYVNCAPSETFVTTGQQINGVIDEWLWSANEAQHEDVQCDSELCWDRFYLGASSSPPWPGNHSTASGCIAVTAWGR